jgi:sulfate transport system substrate-binding protein
LKSLLPLLLLWASHATAERSLLNASYDPTREFYEQYNQLFIEHHQKSTGERVSVRQSHGGSGKQARSVIDGMPADVVTLALAGDIDEIAKQSQLLSKNWINRLPNHSAPYQSTIAFLVRKGNPKQITDWDDVVKQGVAVVTPNPKTSGGAQWNFLAAYEYARRKHGGEEQAKQFVRALFQNAPVLDTGARGATITFVQRGIGDVLIGWENEALLAIQQESKQGFELIVPSLSILAEPSVAVVDHNAQKNGNSDLAEAYLNYLYSEAAQDLIARNFFRPSSTEVLNRYRSQYPRLELFRIDDAFGSWEQARKAHFAEGATFDQIMTPQ